MLAIFREEGSEICDVVCQLFPGKQGNWASVSKSGEIVGDPYPLLKQMNERGIDELQSPLPG